MNRYKPLRYFIFTYELIRIAAILATFSNLSGGSMLSNTEGYSTIPLLAFIAPNVLFVLMALFIALDATAYRAYIPLYCAGKSFFMSSITIWLIFSFRDILSVLLLDVSGAAALVALSMILVISDAISIAAVLVVKKGIRPRGKELLSPSSHPMVIEEIPEYKDLDKGGS